MHLFNVLYFYYYLFFKKIVIDNQPDLIATLFLSFLMSLFINIPIGLFIKMRYSIVINHYYMLAITLIISFVLYFFLHRKGKAKSIIKNKPMLFKSNFISIVVSILFFLLSFSLLLI
jgi:hypothetical protein